MIYHRICANKNCTKSPTGGRREFDAIRSNKLCCCNECAQRISFDKNVEKRAKELLAQYIKSKKSIQDLDLGMQLTANS